MTIQLNITAEGVGELHDNLRALLGGAALSSNNALTQSPPLAPEAGGNEPKQTAAQRKKAELEARARADYAAKEAAAAEAEKAPPTEDDKQDAKDEAADTAESAPEPLKLTHDHVRKLLGGYVMAYGMESAQADGPTLLGVQKISEVPDTQPAIAAAILAIANGIEKNPQKRDMSGDGVTAEKIAELKPFVEAAKAVK